MTLVVIVFAGCGTHSREEELLDTLLLVARNVLQFGRLAAVMQRSVLFANIYVMLNTIYVYYLQIRQIYIRSTKTH